MVIDGWGEWAWWVGGYGNKCYLSPIAYSGVADVQSKRDRVGSAAVGDGDRRLAELQRPVLERSVRQAVPKGEERTHAIGREVSVAYIQPFAVDEPSRVVGEVLIGGAVRWGVREGLGEFARRASLAEEEICHRGAAALP
jgi:hypothetical protein